MKAPRFGIIDAFLLVLVLAAAGGIRAGYLHTCVKEGRELPFQVQDAETAITLLADSDSPAGPLNPQSALVDNIRRYGAFSCKAPLADMEEQTAHVAPAYPWLVGSLAGWLEDADRATQAIRWAQCVLGSLTAGLYFLFARRVFANPVVALLAGLLTAIHPFWIVNTAELQDGTLTCFLLGCCLWLGTAGAQRGGPLTSLLFGLALAAMALTRAALLPYAFIACLWYLLSCRSLPRGWVCALMAFLGFANGLAPWMVRNVRAFGEVLTITDTLYLHLWMGSNNRATGGPQHEAVLRETLPEERLKTVLAESNQARRYGMLAHDLKAVAEDNPTGVVEKRLRAAVCFVFGAAWLNDYQLVRTSLPLDLPRELSEGIPLALRVALLFLLVAGPLGWRWSYGWRRGANLGSLALLWVPLPYILSHADYLSGSRLPLDGILLMFAAFALAWMLPPVARLVFPESEGE